MVKHKEPAHRRAPWFVAGVVDFLYFHRRDVAILRQPRRDGGERAPIVGADRFHLDGGGRDDQIGCADLPGGVVREHSGGRQVGRIAARRSGVRPSRDPGNLRIGQRDVILEFLNADLFLDEPRRHRPPAVAQRRALLDRPGEWTHLLIGEQRHRRNGVRPVTTLTAPLQDRGDIFREGHLVGLRPGGRGGYGHPGAENHRHSGNDIQSSHVHSSWLIRSRIVGMKASQDTNLPGTISKSVRSDR